MRRMVLSILAVILVCTASPAFALFTNGGFETGDFTGWNIEYGTRDYNNTNIYWGSVLSDQPAPAVIGSGVKQPGQTLAVNPYNGSYMARINDVFGDNHATKLWQQDAITQADLDKGGKLYVNWGAILDDPYHPSEAQPYFGISVSKNGSVVNSFSADASYHAKLAGNLYGDDLWYTYGQYVYDMASFNVGDVVKVELYVADCSWGGHGGFAFLDGVGTDYVKPPTVPEPATCAMILSGLAGLVFARRRMSK